MHIPIEYIIPTLVGIYRLITGTPTVIPADVPSLYCGGLIGPIGASCDMTTNRCVKTLPGLPSFVTEHDCSASAIEATATEYDRLRQLVLKNLRPSDSAGRSSTSHSLEILEHLSLSYSEFLKKAPPASTKIKYSDIGLYKHDFQGSFDSIKAMVDIYLTIPGVKWVGALPTLHIVSEMEPHGGWLRGPNPNAIREARLRRSVNEAPPVSRNLEKVFVYRQARDHLPFGYDDFLEYDLAVRGAVNEITEYRNENPGNDENACEWLLGMYLEMVKSSYASRPKLAPIENELGFDFDDGFRRLIAPPTLVPHPYPSPVTNFITENLVGGPLYLMPKVETIDAMINAVTGIRGSAMARGRRNAYLSILLTVINDIGWTDIYRRIQMARSKDDWVQMTAFKARPEHYAQGLIFFWFTLVDYCLSSVTKEMTSAFAKILRLAPLDLDSFKRPKLPSHEFIRVSQLETLARNRVNHISYCLGADAAFLGYIFSYRYSRYNVGHRAEFQSTPRLTQVRKMYAERCGVVITDSTFLD